MHIDNLQHNVLKAIHALTTLHEEGYVVENDQASIWRDRFYALKSIIDDQLHQATLLLEDMKANQLTIATADAEGYWRSAKYLSNFAKQIEGQAN